MPRDRKFLLAEAPDNDTGALEPAVPINQSVNGKHIFCLECGRGFKLLTLHLSRVHGMDVTAYRKKWRLPRSYPTTSRSYSKRRRQIAEIAASARR